MAKPLKRNRPEFEMKLGVNIKDDLKGSLKMITGMQNQNYKTKDKKGN